MLNRPPAKSRAKSSGLHKAGSIASSAVVQEIDKFLERKEGDLFYELQIIPDGTKTVDPKLGSNKTGATIEKNNMAALGYFWEPLLHDFAFLKELRDNISLVSGAYQKFIDLTMEGFSLTCEDAEDNEEIMDILVNDPSVDFAEVVRNSLLNLATLANAYYIPNYIDDDEGFRVENFQPIDVMAIRKIRDEKCKVIGYVQLFRRPNEVNFGGQTSPEFLLPEQVCCGMAYSDGWYAYGKPPIAALPFMTKMKLQMERDMIEMLHQHVPRIDVTFTPDQQMNDDDVKDAIKDAGNEISQLKTTDNYIHTPDYSFEYKGPAGKSLDFGAPMKYVSEQLYAVLPVLSAYLSTDLNINPIIAQQAFRVTCSVANQLRQRLNVMFYPMFKRIADERGLSKIKMSFTDLDAETQEVNARTQEYQAQNAATNRDNGFIDQDTAASHATQKSPGGPVKKAAEPGQLAPVVDPNKALGTHGTPNNPSGKPTTGDGGKPPSKGGRSKVGDAAKGPKGKGRSAPTPDKRPKGKRHEDGPTLDDRVNELLAYVTKIS